MTLPITRFADSEIELHVDVNTSGKMRYNRSKRLSNREPFWLITLTTVPQGYAQGEATAAYLDSLLGELTNFALPNPKPAFAIRNGLTLAANASKGDKTVSFAGHIIDQSDAVVAGDFFQFTSHTKVHKIVFNADANGSGISTATITPPLSQDVTAGTPINYGANVTFNVSLRGSVKTDVSARAGRLITHDIELIEQA